MSELTSKASQDSISSHIKKAEKIIYVRYRDHIIYNRSSALAMLPQIREAIGWLVYDCELYIILSWDRDANPPTLKGGDPKASGLVLLKSDILELQSLKINPEPLQKKLNWHLNRKPTTLKTEYAFRTTERKTRGAIETPKKTKQEKKND